MTAFLHPADIGGRAYLAPADVSSVPPGGSDPAPPTLTGNLTYSATASSITIDWSGTTSADDVAVAWLEYRIGGSGAYTVASAAEEASKSLTFPGLSASTSYQIDLRCVDTSGKASAPLTIGAMTGVATGGETGTNYIRCTLATHEGVLHVNLGALCWALFSQLSPAAFGAPVAKGKHTMTPGSAEVKIAVPAALVPAGWYFLVLSDEDGTTALASPILVGP